MLIFVHSLDAQQVIWVSKEILLKPLKVEFAQSRVNLVNDITLNLDGQKFMRKAYDTKIAVQKHEEIRTGKA